MRLTGNPGGAGHNWVKKRYIDPDPAGYRIITEETEVVVDGVVKIVSLSRVFIPSKIGDNQLLMRNDPTYILRLKQSGSAALVEAWLKGNWDVIDGAFFDEWDESRHVIETGRGLALLKPQWLRFRAFDWGSAKPFSCGWYTVVEETTPLGDFILPKGALVKYREWYGASGPNKGLKMTADLVAQGIVEREKGERIRYGVADPSIYIRDGGPSIGETMAIHRCSWRRADNKRKAGAEALRQRLSGIDGNPMLYFLECCEDSIRTIPTLQHDEDDPEDVDTEAEDHAYDETRYAAMSRPWIPRPPSLPGSHLPKLPSQHTLDELVAKLRQRRIAQSDD
jgi:hypothetical protein